MSHKIIKSSQFVAMEGCSVIDTRFTIEQRVTQLSDGSDETEAISKQTAEIKQLLQEAQVERQEIIAQAIKESDEMRETAKATGFASGEEAGQKEGFQQGYEQGMQEALQQAEVHQSECVGIIGGSKRNRCRLLPGTEAKCHQLGRTDGRTDHP